jgi:hypothetical protein
VRGGDVDNEVEADNKEEKDGKYKDDAEHNCVDKDGDKEEEDA